MRCRCSLSAEPSVSQDVSDPQYRTFRNNIPSLLGLGAAHLGFSKLYSRVLRSCIPTLSPTTYTCGFNIVLMGVLHGANAIKILIIVFLNFMVVRWATNSQNGIRGRVGVGSIWLYNLGILFANDYFQGYRFGALASSLAPLVSEIVSLGPYAGANPLPCRTDIQDCCLDGKFTLI